MKYIDVDLLRKEIERLKIKACGSQATEEEIVTALSSLDLVIRFLDSLPEQPVKSLPEWKWVKPDKQYPVGITREMDVNGDWQYCMSSGRLYESCQYLSLAELELKSVDAGPFPILEDENAADKKAVKEIVKTVHKEVTRQVKEMVGKQPWDIPSAGSGAMGTTPPKFKLEVKEQPASEGLEEEYKDYVENDPVYSKLVNRNAGLGIARHFAEWGAEHAKKAE